MSETKKVALLISSFLPNLGGMEVGLHNIATCIQRLGYEPVVIAPWPHVKKLEAMGWTLPYKVEALPPKIWSILGRAHWLGFAILDMWFARLQKKYGFTFWHVTMGYPAGCAMVHFAERSRVDIQYLIRCAGEDIQKRPDIAYGMRLNPKLDKVISHYLRRAQRLVAITDSVYQDYKDLGIPDEKIYRIPNGVALERFVSSTDREAVRRRYGIVDDELLILSVGRNHPKKNYKILIEAGVRLKKLNLKFKIFCVGKGCQDLLPLVEQYGLGAEVVLINEIGANKKSRDRIALPAAELIELYKSADIFAFPSLTETFGIAIVEAMAAGLPVIVGDSEGCRDIVEGGAWGMLCDPHSAEDLAKRIATLASDPDLAASYRKKSLQRAQDFEWKNIAQKYAGIYLEAAKK